MPMPLMCISSDTYAEHISAIYTKNLVPEPGGFMLSQLGLATDEL